MRIAKFQEPWIKGMLRHLMKKTGVASGVTIIETGKIFHGMQSLDWAFLFERSSSCW
jgi:hypothetical protein